MKKIGIFFIILLVFLLFYLYLQFNNLNFFSERKNSITGNATSQSVALTVTVTAIPSLTIIKPENKTYITTNNLELNFISLSADSVWYNLDNGNNITLMGNTTFNANNGIHTLYLFANNSYGTASKNVTFLVNTSKFKVYYNNYSNNGSSTNFNATAYEDLQNLSGIILERSNHGKIAFNQKINVTDDLNPNDDNTNLDLHTNIIFNFIEIDTKELPNFNKSATLSLYNLKFSNPRILKDNAPCPETICTKINYSNGTLIFNVTQFTNYSAEETPEGPGGIFSAGRGVAGDIQVVSIPRFIIDKEQIYVKLRVGEVKTENFTITNIGNEAIKFKIENLIKNLLVVELDEKEEIILNPSESKSINLNVIAKENILPGLYLGKIILNFGVLKKEILVAIEIESEGVLLDVRVEIIDKYKKILPGEEILSEIRLFNLGESGKRRDILIEYIIKDYDNNEIIHESESLAIETQVTFIKRLKTPSNIKAGRYILYVRAVTPDGKVASSSNNFEVISPTSKAIKKEFIIWIILGILIILIIYNILLKRKNLKNSKKIGKKRNKKRLL
ncbi:MAG: hypothetical protein QXX55_00695 [Candidatus Pacearchaeota archaeon]